MAIKYFEHGEPTVDDVQHSYDKAVSTALFIVEKLAREALRANPEYKEFVMAMGVWGFTDQAGGNMWEEVSEPLIDFMDQWDDYLKLTGTPMRFTADGPVVTEW